MSISLPPVNYQLTFSEDVGAPWMLTQFWLGEAINESYRAIVDAETESDSADTDSLLGADVVVLVSREGAASRSLCGVVARVEYIGVVDHRLIVRFEIIPAFELARQRTDSRIFQHTSVQKVIGEVLDLALADYGRSFDLADVKRGDKPRDYCTQYRESDFDYVSRLLEEEGVSYEFIHDADAGLEVLTFRDANEQYAMLENLDGTPEVPVVERNPGTVDVESIQTLEWGRELVTTATLRRDFDWMTPRNLLTESGSGSDERGRERRAYVQGDRRYIMDDIAKRVVDLREVKAVPGKELRGSSNATAMRAGLRFELSNAERPDLDGEYLITRVRHSGAVSAITRGGGAGGRGDEGGGEAYSNEFEAIPVATPMRPAADTPKPRVHGPQTAIVVGPEGEEIHTDEHARVQVQFHWEEKPSYGANASCWMRVRQSWAGLGWGTQFIPRVGMEVVVEFLEGNPDRPMVTGCVYNGEYPPPFSVPENKTQTGWRTNSSPGGEGFNELRFEDAKGEEEIFMHGEKDWVVKIENDHRENIGNDEYFTIGNNQTGEVCNDQTISVGNDRSESIANNVTETVGEVRTVTSGNNMNFTSKAEISIDAADKITLSCGAASLTMESNGNILLKGATLTIKGSGPVAIVGNPVSTN